VGCKALIVWNTILLPSTFPALPPPAPELPHAASIGIKAIAASAANTLRDRRELFDFIVFFTFGDSWEDHTFETFQ
jgi:hypothetical protein